MRWGFRPLISYSSNGAQDIVIGSYNWYNRFCPLELILIKTFTLYFKVHWTRLPHGSTSEVELQKWKWWTWVRGSKDTEQRHEVPRGAICLICWRLSRRPQLIQCKLVCALQTAVCTWFPDCGLSFTNGPFSILDYSRVELSSWK